MKILINQLGRIGDLILITPAFFELKKQFPYAEIYLIAGDKNYQAVIDNTNLNRIFVYHKGIKGVLKLISQIRKHKFDYYLDPKDHKSTESGLLSKIVKSKVKIGCKNPNANFDIDINEIRAKVDLHFTDVVMAGIKYICAKENKEIKFNQTPKPVLYTNLKSEEYLHRYLIENGINEFLLINISASNSNKMWILDRWNEFITYLISNNYINENLQLIICSAPTESNDAKSLVSKFIQNVYYFQSRNINDIFSLVNKAKLLISPDTSVIHIAAAFDTPIIGLYSGNHIFFDKFKPTYTKENAELSQIIRAKDGDDGIHTIELNQVIEKFEIIKNIFNNEKRN
ncbi:MAG: glycosyltransferase family 9 protein [Candidatus Kapaibacteriota bacterium]|jgi:ADP-heptose:LPS heptosyltransferase